MYEVSYQISEDDYIAAQRLFRRKSSKLQGLGKLVVMLIGLLAAIVGITEHKWWLILGGLVYAAMPWWWFGLIGQHSVRRTYRQYPAMHEMQTLQLLDDAVLMHSSLGETRLTWAMMPQWCENANFVLLYLQPRLFFIIPKRADAEGQLVEQLRQQLRAQGVREL